MLEAVTGTDCERSTVMGIGRIPHGLVKERLSRRVSSIQETTRIRLVNL